MRIVSLLPSATEIVYALGLADQLVGVSFECDEPPAARRDHAVVVGGLDTGGLSPGQIDEQVRARLAAGEQLYTLHAGALAGLAPQLVIAQDLCQVCALPAGEVTRALAHLGCQAQVLSLDPHTLQQVLESIQLVADRAAVPGRGDALVATLRARLAAVASAVQGRRRPRVAVLEWVDPPFTAGHWVPDLVRAAGGQPVGGQAGGRSVQAGWDEFAAGRPELILVAPCGFHLSEAADQARTVLGRLPDVPVWAIDADGLVVRPGPRLVAGVEAIASILHPDAVPPPGPGSIVRVA
ncbi:MAG: ABC transporter substrate-binding protein [Jatrophihabitans sp.]